MKMHTQLVYSLILSRFHVYLCIIFLFTQEKKAEELELSEIV